MTPSADQVARAVVSAGRVLGMDPRLAFQPLDQGQRRDGRARLRLLAAAGLVAGLGATRTCCARILNLHAQALAPSQLVLRRVFSADVAAVAEAVAGGSSPASTAGKDPAPSPSAPDPVSPAQATPQVEPSASPAAAAVRLKRGEPGHVDPRRDLALEARIIAARERGQGPTEIAEAEGRSRNRVNTILKRSGKIFPALKPGPSVTECPAPRAQPAPPPPVQTEAVEQFPDEHPAWAPLPGSTPAVLAEMAPNGCKWPLGSSGDGWPMCCNLERLDGRPYCEQHAWLGVAREFRDKVVKPVGDAAPPPVRMPGEWSEERARAADIDVALDGEAA